MFITTICPFESIRHTSPKSHYIDLSIFPLGNAQYSLFAKVVFYCLSLLKIRYSGKNNGYSATSRRRVQHCSVLRVVVAELKLEKCRTAQYRSSDPCEVLPLDIVENSISPCKRMFDRFSSRMTRHRGRCIRKARPLLPGFSLHQADSCHIVSVFMLHTRSYGRASSRRKGVTQDFPCCPPTGGSSRCHGWGTVPVALRQQLAPTLARLHESYS
jgi:hypothetical protein